MEIVELDPATADVQPLLAEAAGSALASARLVARARAGELMLLGAEEEGRLIGCVAYDRERIAAIAVTPDQRGRGIGRALVERLDRPITVEATEDSVGFFRTCGFSIESAGGTPYVRRYIGTLR